jgi:FkbM family methyltransferase
MIVVYYIYINPERNWKIIVEGQIKDLIVSEILNDSRVYIHICCTQQGLINECKYFISKLFKQIIFSESYINQFEYPGLMLLHNLAKENPDEIMLYIHSKGMVFNNHPSIRSIAEQPTLRATLYNWKQTLSLFDNKFINKVGVWPSEQGFIWLNFFFVRASYIELPPGIHTDRFEYEYYISKCSTKNFGYSDCYSLAHGKIGCYTRDQVMSYICNLKNIKYINDINTIFSKINSFYRIYYGSQEQKIDVTSTALQRCLQSNFLYIPAGDNRRAELFGDPHFGVVKQIFVECHNETRIFEYFTNIYIDINENKIYQQDLLPENTPKEYSAHLKLKYIHSQLKIDYGNFDEENHEQCMAANYLTGNEKVLEFGGNIGRNSLVISKLLKDSSNLVTFECDPESCQKLIHNRDINGLNFHIENAALSKRNLLQRKWDTIVSDVPVEGFVPVKTINYPDFKKKYPLDFDTLIIDCEGAFYYILYDFPEILNGITLIIMENDYHNHSHKLYVDSVLRQKGFRVDYSECGGWGESFNNFYEVWKIA